MNKSVLLLLAEGIELLEMSGFVDVMAWASFSPKIEINVVSASIHPTIQSAFGDLKIQATTQLCDVKLDRFRSEEHTSELQSRSDLVCRLLLEKKNT